MFSDVFNKWLTKQGYFYIKTSNTQWYNQGPRFLQNFPYDRIIVPNDDELQQLLLYQKAIGLRYSTPIESLVGYISYHVVYQAKDYSLSILPKKARYDVRKGQRLASYKPISFDQLGKEGWISRQETLMRQGRSGVESRSWWETLCKSAEGLAGFEAWGGLVNGELGASLIAFAHDECCSILYQQSRTKYLKEGINNALTFTFTQEVIHRPHINEIFYGLHSLDAPPSVDAFKFRMGYSAKPVRQRVVFHPWIAPLMNKVSHKLLQITNRIRPGNPTLSKAEGMLRFYLEGKKPLDEQTWPEALLDKKEELLRKYS